MPTYQGNGRSISIQGYHNEGQQILVKGNGNQISIGDTNAIIQFAGNGNNVHIVHSKLKMTINGNGNHFDSLQCKIALKVQGNANCIKTSQQIQPIQIFNCQGFANQFPQNTVNMPNGNYPNNFWQVNQNNNLSGQNNQSNRNFSNQFPKSNNNQRNQLSIFNNLNSSNNQINGLFVRSMVDQQQQHIQNNIFNGHNQRKQQVERQVGQNWAQQMRLQSQQQNRLKQEQNKIMKQQARQLQQQIRRRERQQQQIRRQQQLRREQLRQAQLNRLRFQQEQASQRQLFGNNGNNRQNINLFSNSYNNQYQVNGLFNGSNNNRNQQRDRNQSRNQPQKNIKQPETPDHGLSQTQLQRLHTHHHTGPQQQCTICFIDIQINDETTFLHCFHKFHSFCIQSWLKKCSKCPICNENVRKNL